MVRGISRGLTDTAVYNKNVESVQKNAFSYQKCLSDAVTNYNHSLNEKYSSTEEKLAVDLENHRSEQYLALDRQNQSSRELVSQYQEELERELLFRSKNPNERRIAENEESILFTNESRSAFDSKAFLEILGIELDVDINWKADGTGELTESQIRHLREKYDVQNLSQNDFYNLLSELSNMNVISHDDVKNQFVRQADPALMENGGILVASDKHFSQWFHSGNDYLSRFQNEALMYDYFIQALINGKSSVDAADIPAVKVYYEKQRDFSNRLAEIFEKIKRDDNIWQDSVQKESKNSMSLVGTNVPDTVQEAWNKAEKVTWQENVVGTSFKDFVKSKYPGAYYNVMDTSRIDDGLWGRNDYPWDAYFSEPADESVLGWVPSGAEPDMQSPEVHAKLNSMVGKIAIVIPPQLEEKMKNEPEFANKVMERVDNFLLTNFTPGLNDGFLITFDENGEIHHACVVGEGRFTVSSSEFVEARKAREVKLAEYESLAEEAALKRRLMEQEALHYTRRKQMRSIF